MGICDSSRVAWGVGYGHLASASGIELTPIKVSAHAHCVRCELGLASATNQGFTSNAGFVVTDYSVLVIDALGQA